MKFGRETQGFPVHFQFPPERNRQIRLPAPVGKCSSSRALLAAGSIWSTEPASTGSAKMTPRLAAAVRHFPEPKKTPLEPSKNPLIRAHYHNFWLHDVWVPESEI